MDFKNLLGKELSEKQKSVMECAEMMEKYLSRFPAEKGCTVFSDEDMNRWKTEFFPKLVQSGEIVDYQFFDPKSPCMGVGNDGAFAAVEYFQIMYRLYKKLYEMGSVK